MRLVSDNISGATVQKWEGPFDTALGLTTLCGPVFTLFEGFKLPLLLGQFNETSTTYLCNIPVS